MASPLDLLKKDIKPLYLPKQIDLAVNMIQAFIKNNNIVGLKIAIILSGAKHLVKYEEDNKVRFDVDELCSICNITRRYLSSNLKKITGTYFSYVSIDGNIGGTRPIHSYEYANNNKDIYLEVSSKGKELFTELGKGKYSFTQAISSNLMNLKHKHSLRMQLLLEMINNYDYGKRKKMSLEELNGYFGTNYKRFVDIERKILKPVQEEIQFANSLSFVYSLNDTNQGTGRPKITEIVIDVTDNEESLFALNI